MNAIDDFLAAITSATIPGADCWAPQACLDATIPEWRIQTRGPLQIKRLFSGWYADVGRFEEFRRTPLPDGELIEFLLTWTEHGVPHAAHQAHVLRLGDGQITDHVVYCGGRWPAGLMARMAEAANEPA
jgi:hypothetical protein